MDYGTYVATIRSNIDRLGDAAEDVTLVSTLSRWGGVEQLAPLIARVGGDDALAAIASVLPEVLRWTPRG